jgi:hypothetical protein
MASECTDICGELYLQTQAYCAFVEQENLAICADNHQIDELQCEADQLECELMCLPVGTCDCETPYLACLVQAGLDLSACQMTVHASRVVCDEDAAFQYMTCLANCSDHVFFDGFESGDTSGWTHAIP